jgi:hypothetical protein
MTPLTLLLLAALAVSPDGTRVATLDAAGRLRIASRDDPQGAALEIATAFRPSEIATMRFSSDGRRVVCVLRDGTAVAWDAETGKRVARARLPAVLVVAAPPPVRQGLRISLG